MIWRASVVLMCSCVWACGEQVGGILHSHEASEAVAVSGEVVSRIDGSAIGVTEVERLANVGNLPPQAALVRLQAERLLGQEARARGYARHSQTELVAREALVQELLQQVVEPVDVSQEELQAEYRAQKARFSQPERRSATHVLAKLAADASSEAKRSAEAFIKGSIRALQSSQDTEATLSALRAETSPDFTVLVEDLPLAANDGKYVAEFSRALFSTSATGALPDVVKTEFGYHAIVIREIVPATSESESVAFETLKQEITIRKRTQQLQSLLADLRKNTRVKFAGDTQKILATLDF